MNDIPLTLGLRPAARELGISHVALLKASKEGRVQRRDDGKFDVEECRKAIKENSHPIYAAIGRKQQRGPSAPAPDPDEGSQSIAEAARQLEWERLRALKQKTDHEEGRLANVPEVNAFVAGMIIKARDELARIGSESADELARETDPAKCRSIVDVRIFQVLEGLKQFGTAWTADNFS